MGHNTSWLFLNTKQSGDVRPRAEAERKLDIEHVADWRELDGFLNRRIVTGSLIYFEPGPAMLPENPSATTEGQMPAWVRVLQKEWPSAEFRSAGGRLATLMAVESSSEQQTSRAAAQATMAAFAAGAKAVRPGISQREVELAVVEACWKAGAHGVSFWPWAVA
jgi:Xaa-Pro aminopeptidase